MKRRGLVQLNARNNRIRGVSPKESSRKDLLTHIKPKTLLTPIIASRINSNRPLRLRRRQSKVHAAPHILSPTAAMTE